MPLLSPIKQSIALLSIAAIMAGCHGNQAPKQANTNTTAATPPTNYNNGPDTSGVKPIVDRNAKDGLNTVYYKSGTIKAKGVCFKGLKEGEWQSFYEDGKLWSDEYFTKGIRDGKITVWYENGQKFYEGEYKNGRQVNTWTYWKENGQVLRTADYNKVAPNTAL